MARTLARIIAEMVERGHRIHIVRPHQGATDTQRYVKVDKTIRVWGIPIPGYSGLKAGWPALVTLYTHWRRSRPDVLYVATEGPLGWAAVVVARYLKIPVISGFHTNFHSYSDHYRIGMLKGIIQRYLARFHNRTAVTLAPTRALCEELTGLGFGNVDVLGRGIDLRLYSPGQRSDSLRRSWGLEADDLAVLYVGRLAAEKNIQLAIDAFDAMKVREPRLRFVFVGDGPIADVLAHGRDDLVMAGVHTGQSLARHYASADIFLFPSETETFGNVVLEAMASGLALVAYDYAAVGEVGEHGVNGLFPPLSDTEEFIEMSVSLVEKREKIGMLRHNARESVMDRDWKSVFDRFERQLFRFKGDSGGNLRLDDQRVTSAAE
ncbi:MAG: glycosyltransferase family 1 protein [Sedimenticola sp.]